MSSRAPAGPVEDLPPEIRRRMLLTTSCRDCDTIPKVPGAGAVRTVDATAVQVMHNGVVVEEGCYYGPWMTEIIRALRGHHEPQEELVFHRIIERLAASERPTTMIELGSFWAYYSLWFLRSVPSGTVVAVEPDPAYLEVGRRNVELNGESARVRFVHAAVGTRPGETVTFRAESSGEDVEVPQADLRSVMDDAGLDHVDLVLADVQGAETVLLERALPDLRAGRVRFLVVSTHHHSISGDALTHQRALALLESAGGHVIAEHGITESYSGDGLVAVSFDDRDRDLRVRVSRVRARRSLFGEVEPDLAAAWVRLREVDEQRAAIEHERDRLASELQAATTRASSAEAARTSPWGPRLRAWYQGAREWAQMRHR